MSGRVLGPYAETGTDDVSVGFILCGLAKFHTFIQLY